MRITKEYLELNTQKHWQSDQYGIGGAQFAPIVYEMTKQFKTEDVLDYGCGKATLQAELPFSIKLYDPAVPKYSAEPLPANLLVCTDVLEHIEPQCLEDVLEHMASLCKTAFFFTIALRPSIKMLPDGTPTHKIVEPATWWFVVLSQRFFITKFEINNGIAICSGLAKSAEESTYKSWHDEVMRLRGKAQKGEIAA